MPSTAKKANLRAAPTASVEDPMPQGKDGSEANFDAALASNRVLSPLDPTLVPAPPKNYRPTDPAVRRRRLRHLSGELRADVLDALYESGSRDLRGELGKQAPNPWRAMTLIERVKQSGALVNAVQALMRYASEAEEIALSEALGFLEVVNDQVDHVGESDPAVAEHFRAVSKLFAIREASISAGIGDAEDAEVENAPPESRQSLREPPVPSKRHG